MSLAILGIGTALPAHDISQPRAADVARVLCCLDDKQFALLSRLYRQSLIEGRHFTIGDDIIQDILNGTRYTRSIFLPSGAPDDHGPTTSQRMRYYAAEALPLAERAARQALERSGLNSSAITHLITVSCTGFAAPGLDVGLIKHLHLAPTVQRTHVGFMGCHGAVNGLRVAQAFADARSSARVLLCSTELCSIHFYYGWDPERNVGGALFSDGAAAVVGGPDAMAPRDAWIVTDTGSCLFDDSENAMSWTIGDHGFDMALSTRIPALIAGSLRPWLEEWLGRNGLATTDVRSWAVHPGGPRILNAVEECLCLPSPTVEVSREVLADCGNMSSATILFILDRLVKRRAPRPCVALAFGPGLVAEAALLR